MNQKDIAWNKIWNNLPIVWHNGLSQIITSDDIKLLGNIEPRIACHFSSSKELPSIMKKNNVFPLAIKNKNYILVKGNGFQELEFIDKRPVDFISLVNFNIDNISGTGESKFLAYAHNSGLISEFLKKDNLLKWEEGKCFSHPFEFTINNIGPIKQEGVQIQVDGLYFHDDDYACVIEAKSHYQEDFNIRQLYYPYRHWKIQKEFVDPIFLIIYPKEKIYYFWKYYFQDENDYSSIKLVETSAYRIIEKIRDPKELEKSTPNKKLGWNVPQADDFEKIIIIPDLINAGIDNNERLRKKFKFSSRQADYYSQACEMLGLIDKKDGKYFLTYIGEQYISLSYYKKIELLVNLLLHFPSMKLIYNNMKEIEEKEKIPLLTSKDIGDILCKNSNLSGLTPYRRAKTIFSWFKWISESYGVVSICHKKYLTLHSSIIKLDK